MTYNALLIDVGSTSIKWAIGGGPVSSRPFPASRSKPPLYEVDPAEIVRAVTEIIDGARPRITSVYFSVQMHGYVLCGDGNRPVTGYISWRDRRSALLKEPPAVSLALRSGTAVKANLPLVSVLALKSLDPDAFARAREFYTLGSYIVYRLTGRNASHITDAAASGFYDVSGKRRNHNLPLKLPDALTAVSTVGTYKNVGIYTPVGDQQAAICGTLFLAPETHKDCRILNIGTAAQVCVAADRYVEGAFETRPYFDGKFLPTVTGLIGGADLAARAVTAEELAGCYGPALQRLPPRPRLLVTGGAVAHRRDVLARALGLLEADPVFIDGETALRGLQALAG
ncbi:MAG: hypothetical protein LBL66_09580 [Clostridiales bacterium]|jgi:sugar (pentulose or hexulose) kinase|nr:hypothetical protein [Clostridiales bacterium]